ncbi:hypothetical protein MTP99_008569 [Tenebrio molitor]|nr:hypothetical protein MTP99_008569 [Tenebrio molitor]
MLAARGLATIREIAPPSPPSTHMAACVFGNVSSSNALCGRFSCVPPLWTSVCGSGAPDFPDKNSVAEACPNAASATTAAAPTEFVLIPPVKIKGFTFNCEINAAMSSASGAEGDAGAPLSSCLSFHKSPIPCEGLVNS